MADEHPLIASIKKVLNSIINEKGIEGERRLWARVLLQAIQDVQGKANSVASKHHQHLTKVWLRTYSDCLEAVCDLAGISPSFFHQSMVKWLCDDEEAPERVVTSHPPIPVRCGLRRHQKIRKVKDVSGLPLFAWNTPEHLVA